MGSDDRPVREGYQPGGTRGYQPEQQPSTPSEPSIGGGYQPTEGEGDNPANEPSPPTED